MNKKTRINRTRIDLGLYALLAGFALIGAAGCCDECDDPVYVDYPPAAPTGLYSVTGNLQVDIFWNANTESDLEGYDIFWSPTPVDEDFEYMVSRYRHENYFTDFDVENSVTYYYKVRAFDRSGHTSDFSDMIQSARFRPAIHNGRAVDSRQVRIFSTICVYN